MLITIRAKSPYAYGHHHTGMETHTRMGENSSQYAYSHIDIIVDAYGHENTIVDAYSKKH